MKTVRCLICGDKFWAEKGKNGRLRKTCSLPCQIYALERYIERLQRNRAELVAELEDQEGDEAPELE